MVSSILKKKNWGYNETTSWLMDLLWAVWLYMRVNTPIFFLSKLKRHCILSCNVKRINISSIEKIKAKKENWRNCCNHMLRCGSLVHMTIHKDFNNFWYAIIDREVQENSPTQYSEKKMTPMRLKNLYCWMDRNSNKVSAESFQTHFVLSSFKRHYLCWPTTYLTMGLEFFEMFYKTSG